jgi:RIO-like serine/threonine protein kinase
MHSCVRTAIAIAAYNAGAAALNVVLGRQIAAGNFSHVFYGTSAQFGEVCVKFLKPSRTARDESFRNKNFEREVTLMR